MHYMFVLFEFRSSPGRSLDLNGSDLIFYFSRSDVFFCWCEIESVCKKSCTINLTDHLSWLSAIRDAAQTLKSNSTSLWAYATGSIMNIDCTPFPRSFSPLFTEYIKTTHPRTPGPMLSPPPPPPPVVQRSRFVTRYAYTFITYGAMHNSTHPGERQRRCVQAESAQHKYSNTHTRRNRPPHTKVFSTVRVRKRT